MKGMKQVLVKIDRLNSKTKWVPDDAPASVAADPPKPEKAPEPVKVEVKRKPGRPRKSKD